jgi:hypothetical protein
VTGVAARDLSRRVPDVATLRPGGRQADRQAVGSFIVVTTDALRVASGKSRRWPLRLTNVRRRGHGSMGWPLRSKGFPSRKNPPRGHRRAAGRPHDLSRTLRPWAGFHGRCLGRSRQPRADGVHNDRCRGQFCGESACQSTTALPIPYVATAPPRNARAKTVSA